jgi:hypothetical protein
MRDEREAEIPSAGLFVFADPETGEQLIVDTSNQGLKRDFTATISAENNWLSNEIAAAGADLLAIGTREDYVPKLHSFFKRRERAK